MRRRTLLAGAALTALAPLVAPAQSQSRRRRIGVLMAFAEGDPEGAARLQVFELGLTELGWTQGRNLELVQRWAGSNIDRLKAAATEIVQARPDIVMADRSAATAALLEATRQIPIVFVQVTDPVGQKLVGSLARPGGNVTGFTDFEPSMAGKWVELLKEIAPRIARAGLPYNPETAVFVSALIPSFEAAARAKGIEPMPTPVRDIAQLEQFITQLGRGAPGGGLVMPPDTFLAPHRNRVAQSLIRSGVPAIAVNRLFVRAGVLVSYGNDAIDLYRRAAGYVDRLLKGEQPSQLPVQAPVKFELAINLTTARALNLVVPQSLLFRADEIIE